MKKDILLKFLERIDLHIVALLIMLLLLWSATIFTLVEQTKDILGVKIIVGILFFLMPQGIILMKVIKSKGFKFRITDKEYFFVNELLALFFVFLSCCMNLGYHIINY